MAYTSVYRGVGSSAKPFVLSKANKNYTTRYFKSTIPTGYTGPRVNYDQMEFASTGGGEVTRNVAYVSGTGGGTPAINAQHNMLRFAAAGSITGMANAGRFTVEGGTTGAPGGTVGAVLADCNFGSGVTLDNMAAFRVTKSGSKSFPYVLAIDDSALEATKSSASSTKGLPVRLSNGSTAYIMLCA